MKKAAVCVGILGCMFFEISIGQAKEEFQENSLNIRGERLTENHTNKSKKQSNIIQEDLFVLETMDELRQRKEMADREMRQEKAQLFLKELIAVETPDLELLFTGNEQLKLRAYSEKDSSDLFSATFVLPAIFIAVNLGGITGVFLFYAKKRGG
ncbi:hypothetical protein IW492_15150 [Enterococcus sp. BWB1-3]|uniref:hypothetical protein n=1 Tax=Enterococcus sp. BWB1-3 TaxID=2787713 RepID=UPI0019216DA2|nr:hypothetical protein [Enterococcus sp. BWB1-3]MBL1230567.1 hypothetical protein [Enterococcus sp. BWB1-3]